MIGTGFVVGVLDRRGTPDLDRISRAAEVHGGSAQTLRSGALAVAWTTPVGPARDGAALAVVDGIVDTDPRIGPASPALDPAAVPGAVLEAWQRGEASLLGAIRGDFALLLWDGTAGTLVRDHQGGRTWVVHDDGSRLLFATEVVALLAALEQRPSPDLGAVAHWIGMSGMPGAKTLFAGVDRIPAGCLRPLDAERPRPTRRWWELRYRTPERIGGDEAAARLRAAIEAAITRRARPGQGHSTSVQLSGGLDSSSVGGIASTLDSDRRPQRSYSVVFPDHPSVDENALIVAIARQIGTADHRLAVRSGSVLEGTLPYIERWDLPPVSPNLFFWNRMLAKAGADGTVVMLDGEGGDEVYGAAIYLIADVLRRRGPRAAAEVVRTLPGGRPDLPFKRAWPFIKQYGVMGLPPAWVHAFSRRVRPAAGYLQDYVLPATVAEFAKSVDGAAWKRHGGPRWWSFLVDATTQGMGPALAYDHGRRRAAMAGIVPRHPLSDPDVVETVLSLPPDLAFDPRWSRPLLRQAVQGLIPEEVRTRKGKSTFDEIFHASLAGPDLPLVRGLLGDPGARVGEYVDLAMVRATLLDPEPPPAGQGRQQWALYTWRLLTLEAWLRRQEDPAGLRPAAEAIGLPEPDVRWVDATVPA